MWTVVVASSTDRINPGGEQEYTLMGRNNILLQDCTSALNIGPGTSGGDFLKMEAQSLVPRFPICMQINNSQPVCAPCKMG